MKLFPYESNHYNILSMEHLSRSASRIKRRECFLTETPKEDARVHFKESGIFTPQHQPHASESTPVSNFKRASSSELKSAEGRSTKKVMSMSRLKTILKDTKEDSSRKTIKKEGKSQLGKSQSSQQVNKYYRISINDDEMKQSAEGSEQGNGNISTGLMIKPSINMFLQRSQTETPRQEGNLNETTKSISRLQKRRKCRITTQKQFEEECSKYIQSKDREETNELFRQLNREMKLHQKRKDPNNYYQKIRRSALKKIDYMSYNQKYYDDQEVKHLYNVVDNCNILIHKRGNDNQKQYKRVATDQNLRFQHKEPQDEHNRTSFSTKELKTTRFLTQPIESKPMSKRSKLSKNEKSYMSKRMNDIVDVCENERKMLEEVKNGMKVFEFYCSKLDYGFAVKGKRLNNYLLGEEEN